MDAHSSHQGYFSIDKKKGKKARFVEGKVDRKTQTSDDTDAYDLIMRDKERLLSLTSRCGLSSRTRPCTRAGITRMCSRSAR